MKKKVLMAAIAAVVSVGAYAGFSANKDIALQNAEALAVDGNTLTEIKCNEAIPDVCFLLNKKPMPGEHYGD